MHLLLISQTRPHSHLRYPARSSSSRSASRDTSCSPRPTSSSPPLVAGRLSARTRLAVDRTSSRRSASGCRGIELMSSDGSGTARVHVGEIAVESGALYFVAQLVFVVRFALGRPAQAIAMPSSVQVYVSLSSLSSPSLASAFLRMWWRADRECAGHCIDTDCYPHGYGYVGCSQRPVCYSRARVHLIKCSHMLQDPEGWKVDSAPNSKAGICT